MHQNEGLEMNIGVDNRRNAKINIDCLPPPERQKKAHLQDMAIQINIVYNNVNRKPAI
jgi:hypothetical protein